MKRTKNLFKLLKGNIGLVGIVIVLTIIHRLTYSYIPLFTEILLQKLNLHLDPTFETSTVNLPKIILDFINNNVDILNIVLSVAIALILWQIMRYFLMYFENLFKGLLSENVGRKIRLKSYNHIQNLSYEYHNNVDSGDLIQRVTSDIELTKDFVSYRFMDLLATFSSMFFGAYQMYFVNKTIMFVSLAIIPIIGVASIIYFKKIDLLFQNVEEKEAELMVVIQENVSASKVVRAFANEKYETEKLEEKNKAFKDADIKASKVVAIYWGSMDFLMMLQYMAVLLIGIYYAQRGLMDVAKISSAIMLAGMLIWPIRGLGRIINDFGKALVAADRLDEILKLEDEYIIDGKEMPNIDGHIIFKDVSFKFRDDKDYLFKNISFEIKPGETIAIIGKTGSGKSTIINILLRMYEYEGSITIDGIELREINKKHLRSNIGTVLQDPFLYSKTVYENIAIANKKASKDLIYNASQIAALDRDINTFQAGYDTIVGEQGTTLSGGQKQRVAIARILVSDKPIIIFDDALSALDNKTDLDI
ncbi:MAG TPA: ABC transporter ATP-binding protein, partial [Acholeplasma sp.]|nr:ABC transporter ATP-binding protein [Acholeplasma sp.]